MICKEDYIRNAGKQEQKNDERGLEVDWVAQLKLIADFSMKKCASSAESVGQGTGGDRAILSICGCASFASWEPLNGQVNALLW
jgi:hypothetical protein